MTPFIQSLFTTYLIFPILGLLLVAVAAFVAKKNKLLSNKRLIFYVLLSIVIMVLPALLGVFDYGFMPYGYLFSMMLYAALGRYNIALIPKVVFKEEGVKYRTEFGITLLLTLSGMVFYALVFNLCNELQYGLFASTCMLPFLLVSLFVRTYRLFLAIPESIYKVWRYNTTEHDQTYDNIDYSKLKLVKVELFKNEKDAEPLHLSAKAPDHMPFGVWIKRLISDYNLRSPLSPIDNYSSNETGGWIFYLQKSVFLPNHYIDYERTVKENRIKENDLIVAKRVVEAQDS